MTRKIYNKSPLKEVIFQVKFPTLLIIDQVKPADFQSRIIMDFPLYEENNSDIKELIINPVSDETQMNKTRMTNYVFTNASRKSRVILNNSSLTITTLEYTNWEAFSKLCYRILGFFKDIYKFPFFNRLGLRYINVIVKSEYNLVGLPWKDIVKPEYLGNMSNVDDSSIRLFNMSSEIVDGTSRIIVKEKYGLVKIESSNEISFLADADYIYPSSREIKDVERLFESLHDESAGYIDRVVSNEVIERMEPLDVWDWKGIWYSNF